jgi:predicted nucleic-acid-binding Zn-ribbon protein
MQRKRRAWPSASLKRAKLLLSQEVLSRTADVENQNFIALYGKQCSVDKSSASLEQNLSNLEVYLFVFHSLRK